jgi:hypothetical protein
MKAETLLGSHETPESGAIEDETVEILADAVVARGLVTPAILVLELLKPFSFIGSQFLLLLQPVLGPWSQKTGRYARLLEDRESVERLLQRLDQEKGG